VRDPADLQPVLHVTDAFNSGQALINGLLGVLSGNIPIKLHHSILNLNAKVMGINVSLSMQLIQDCFPEFRIVVIHKIPPNYFSPDALIKAPEQEGLWHVQGFF
jgi:hypothetical protein